MACDVDGVPQDAIGVREPYHGDCTEWSGSFNSSRPESLDGLRIELSAGSDVVLMKQRNPVNIKTMSDRLVAATGNCSWRYRKTAISTVCWITLRDKIGCPRNFSLYFCLDRPQYLVVLTDHSLDALSEMR